MKNDRFEFDLVEYVDEFVELLKKNNYNSVVIINDFMQDYVQNNSSEKIKDFV